jgi:hypothetical protein
MHHIGCEVTDVGGEEVLPGFWGVEELQRAVHDPEHELELVPGKSGMGVPNRVQELRHQDTVWKNGGVNGERRRDCGRMGRKRDRGRVRVKEER